MDSIVVRAEVFTERDEKFTDLEGHKQGSYIKIFNSPELSDNTDGSSIGRTCSVLMFTLAPPPSQSNDCPDWSSSSEKGIR